MRARAVLTVLTLVPVLLGAQQGGRNQDTRPGIAVLPFTNGGSYGQGKEDFDALERGIAGMMISELSQNPAARVVERQEVQHLIDEQNLGAQGRVDPQTAAKVGKLVGAHYVVLGTFIDFYGDFRVDVRLVNTETSEIVKTESERMQRDHMFDIIRNIARRLSRRRRWRRDRCAWRETSWSPTTGRPSSCSMPKAGPCFRWTSCARSSTREARSSRWDATARRTSRKGCPPSSCRGS